MITKSKIIMEILKEKTMKMVQYIKVNLKNL